MLDTRFELGLATAPADDPRLAATPFLEEPLELILPVAVEVRGWDDLQRLGFIDHPDGQAMARRLLGLRYPRNPGIATLPVRGFTNQLA